MVYTHERMNGIQVRLVYPDIPILIGGAYDTRTMVLKGDLKSRITAVRKPQSTKTSAPLQVVLSSPDHRLCCEQSFNIHTSPAQGQQNRSIQARGILTRHDTHRSSDRKRRYSGLLLLFESAEQGFSSLRSRQCRSLNRRAVKMQQISIAFLPMKRVLNSGR